MSCFGEWIINNETIPIDLDGHPFSDEHSQRGYIFTEFKTEAPDEYILSLGVNASRMKNNSWIQCQFQTLSSPHTIVRSRTARVLVLPSELTILLLILLIQIE